MALTTGQRETFNLATLDGPALFSGCEAILKGILECDRTISLVTGPAGVFDALFLTAATEQGNRLLQSHGTRVLPAPTARRGLHVAMRKSRAGEHVVALVPNNDAASATQVLDGVVTGELLTAATAAGDGATDNSGALCIIMEDDPTSTSAICPRQLARTVGLTCIEPSTVSQLRDAIESAIRLSRAGNCPVAIIAHHHLLRSAEMLQARPNRVIDAHELAVLRRRRRQRRAESTGVLRMARRLELNQVRALPSPGERVAVGFLTVGPADAALRHVTHSLRLHGRVPILHLGLLHPMDEVLIERFLTRCEQVIVLEPRPGSIYAEVLAAAESLRHRATTPATIWGRLIPPQAEQAAASMQIDDAVHVSRLARRVVHLLHPLRPTLQVSSKLASSPPMLQIHPPGRGAGLGESAAMAALRRVLADVDQRLRSMGSDDQPQPHRTLAINGASLSPDAGQRVAVEILSASAFRDFAAAGVNQLAMGERPAMLLVVDLDNEPGEMQRLARASISAAYVDRVNVMQHALGDEAELRECLLNAASDEQLTIVIVRDSKPPKYSLTAVQRVLRETDRLGFEPRQWLVRPADEACSIREFHDNESSQIPEGTSSDADVKRLLAKSMVDDEERAELVGSGRHELESIMRNRYVAEKLSKRQSQRMRVKIQPLVEQIEVVRTRPPAWVWRGHARRQIDLPSPIHARQSAWRIHIAGWRGSNPGVAARVLCEAGVMAGYDVRALHDSTFVAPGCRAWAEVLFTRASADGDAVLVAQVPYGEADVLLGVDWREALRSITPAGDLQVADPDRTCTLLNVGMSKADSRGPASAAEQLSMAESFRAVSRDDHCVIDDFAATCRTWFYTDRVTDIAMLGAAFQRGLVPIPYDAIKAALQRVEATGYGRTAEAFEFGRWLGSDSAHTFGRRKQRDDAAEDIHRVTRRMVLSVQRSRWGGRTRARRFQRLLQQCIMSTPGLSETAAGRQAQRDMVAALYRCLEWGGQEYANRYGQLIMALYRADRGEKGRALTRDAVLPLAEVMLVRDQVYIACMATSPEQRRRLQAAGPAGPRGSGLNVKRARGDHVERRYLTRLEFIGFGRRYRLDLRTSDWPARVAKASRIVLPQRWRGSRRDRELRHYIIDFVQRATHGCSGDYDTWSEAMHRLHQQAVQQRLRSMAVSEVRMLVEGQDLASQFTATEAEG